MMLTHSLKSKSFWPALGITLLISAILASLGAWQLQRLHWKTALIDSLQNEEKIAQAPNFEAWEVSLTNPEPVLYFGYYIPQSTIFVPQGDKTIVYMPFKATNGVIVMMRRGTLNTTDTADLVLDEGKGDKIISVIGVPIPRPRIIPFMTVSHPDNLTWPFLDWAAIKARFSEQPLAPYTVQVLVEPEGPLALTRTTPQLRNDHLQYAIFWFAMSIIALVLFSRFLIFAPCGKQIERDDV